MYTSVQINISLEVVFLFLSLIPSKKIKLLEVPYHVRNSISHSFPFLCALKLNVAKFVNFRNLFFWEGLLGHIQQYSRFALGSACGLLLVGFRKHMGCWESNPGQLHAKQMSFALYSVEPQLQIISDI